MEQRDNPLHIFCRNCGAPTGFDIVKQTYRCQHCGEITGISEVNRAVTRWKKLQKENCTVSAAGSKREEHSCPGCGAIYSFGEGEATADCIFCGSKLVRKEFTNLSQLPEVIIPFFLERSEAEERLKKWAEGNSGTPEGKMVLENIGSLKGAYLPYRLIRGPVGAVVNRPGTERIYRCEGFLEGIAINCTSSLDNLILNDIEPFDWSALKAFDFGYIAGQSVKLNDLSDKAVNERTEKETEEDFLPLVKKIMQTSGVGIKVSTGDVSSVSALLPVYFIKNDKGLAVMNGQTGRIAVSTGRIRNSYIRFLEPTIYTVVISLIISAFAGFTFESIFYSTAVFGAIIFAAMEKSLGVNKIRVVLKSEVAKSARTDGRLEVTEEKNILKNPYDNTPVFIEKDENGRPVPAKITFYSPVRLMVFLVQSFVLVFLPAICAVPCRFLTMGVGEGFWDKFHIGYGAAWYCLTVVLVVVYYVKVMRGNIYEKPLVYQIMEDKSLRLIKQPEGKSVGFLSMFADRLAQTTGRRVDGNMLKELFLSKEGMFLLGALSFIFLGSFLAIFC